MKKPAVKIASCVLAAAMMTGGLDVVAETENEKIYWQCSTEDARWVDMGVLETSEWDDDTTLYIEVDETTRYQTLTDDPWGGCFSERGWKAMENLTEKERSEIVKNLFGEEGLKLTVGRMPLGNNDYSIERSTSYDELPDGVETDYDLEYFSVDNDREYLMPYIDEAMKYCPSLKLWASPWSPPSWMKTNGTIYGGGELIWTEEMLTTYANYFVKFIEAYRGEGYNIYMVMPQNEPTMNTAYASCIWSGEQLNEFIRDYLSPALKAAGLDDVEIYLGTFTDSQTNRVDPTLNDSVTSTLISGIGVQWWAAPLTKRIYRTNRDKGYVLMQSETKCGSGGNTWSYAEEQFDCVKEFFDAGVNSYMLWNMVLDEKGENTSPSPWYQNAPITVDSTTNEVSYNGQYYMFKHITYYVEGGARRILTDGNYEDKLAFQNEDGENVLVVKNSSDSDLTVAINFNGKKIKPTIPAHSISTFRLMGDATGFDELDVTYSQSGDEDEEETLIKLHSAESSLTLSVDGAGFDDGDNIIAWTDQGTADQLWTPEKTEDGYFKLVNYNSLKALGVYAGSTFEGARCVQWSADGTANQEWEFIPLWEDSSVYYYIKNKGSGLYLGFESETSGAQAVQLAEAKKWEIITMQGDGVDIENKIEFASPVCEADKASVKVRALKGGTYNIYCAQYDSEGKLTAVETNVLEMTEGAEAKIEAEIAQNAARVVFYAWTAALSPVAEKLEMK